MNSVNKTQADLRVLLLKLCTELGLKLSSKGSFKMLFDLVLFKER